MRVPLPHPLRTVLRMRSLRTRQRDILVLVLAVTMGTIAVAGAAPEFVDNPSVTLDITANDGDNLSSPASVTAIGAGFTAGGAGVSGVLLQCTADFSICSDPIAQFTSTSAGNFSQTITVSSSFTGLNAMNQPVQVDCLQVACKVRAESNSGQLVSAHHISFAGSTTTSSSTSTSIASTTTSSSTSTTLASTTTSSSTSTSLASTTTSSSTSTTLASTTTSSSTSTTLASTTTSSSTSTSTTRPPTATCDGVATITGTSGDDRIFGTPGPDVILGGGGNDVLLGLGGNDLICGGTGSDRIFGGSGNDRLFGEDGSDQLFGEDGNDLIAGGAASDRCFGDAGTDSASSCEIVAGVP